MSTKYSEATFSTILIIDDEVRLALNLRKIFLLEGIDARICHDAETAVAMLPEFRPDVILLDLNLGPGNRSGMEALSDILDASPSSCVLMYTGYGDVPKAVEAMHAGAWDMIQKGSYQTSELVTILRERYRKKRERDDDAKERVRILEKEATRETARQLASGIVHDAAHRVQECSYHLIRIESLVAADIAVGEIVSKAKKCLGKLDETLAILGQFSQIPFVEIAPLQIKSSLCSAVEECKQRIAAMDKREIAIDIMDFQPGVLVVSNERILRMALLALLQNACEAQETVLGRVTIRQDITDGQVAISIIDRGVGISVEDLSKIGTNCFTTKGSAGNGLGVLFASAVAKRSNGTFELQNNNPPPGATAIMRLPHFESERVNQTGVES